MEHWKAIELARRYVDMKRGQPALDALKHASPEAAETWLQRANALHALGRYEDAIEAAQTGLAIEPENGYLHHAIARAEGMRGRWADAERAIREALRLQPDEPEALALLAMILDAAGKREERGQAVSRALELAPELRGVKVVEALLSLRRTDEQSEDLTRELLHAMPEGAEEHWLRALAFLRRARFREAAFHFTRAAALQPENKGYVRSARTARHWMFWPLRVTSPYSIAIAWYLGAPLAILGFFGLDAVWPAVASCAAFLLYSLAGLFAMSR